MDKIDAEDFEAKRVFEGLLKTQTLKNLVQTNLEIQAEIKSLDHDVQSLVFENYSKFISSIDVVKKMREEVEKTETDLERLTESIDRIKRYTNSIDETLKPKRAEIQRLDKINKDLSNLKVLCELPIMLKEDLKALHAMDLLTLSAEELSRLSPDILRLLRKSLDSLNMCKDKLIEFCREPLIAPIFADVNKYLKEIQNYMFLHFHDNNTKMKLDLLSDGFTKLANIVLLNDLMNPAKRQTGGQNTIENLIVVFFKYAQTYVQRQCKDFGGVGPQGVGQALADEPAVDGAKTPEAFRTVVQETLMKGGQAEVLAQLKELFHSVFQSISGVDKNFQKMGLPSDVLGFYNTRKHALYRRFLFEALSKTLDGNFLAKAQLISENKVYVGEPTQLDALLEYLAEEVLIKDALGLFDQLLLREQKKLVAKEFLDFRGSRFPLIRDEMNLKNELAAQAEAFGHTLRSFGGLIAATLEGLLAGSPSGLTPNADSVPLILLDRLLGSQNNKLNIKTTIKLFKKREISMDTSQLNDSRLAREGQKGSVGITPEEQAEVQVVRPKLKGGLRLFHYIFATRVLHSFQDVLSRSQFEQLVNKNFAALFSFFGKEFLRAFGETVERPNEVKAQTDLLNLVRNLVFLANNLVQEGVPKSRLTKPTITSQFTKSSETSKLLARQASFFEDASPVTRQKLFFGLTKLFFKSLRVYFVQNAFRAAGYSGLFILFAQASQTLFELCEKEDESSFAALFYQGVDDFEKAGCVVDAARRNQILAKFKEQTIM